MCGIAGFYKADADFTSEPKWRHRLRAMKDSLCRRGPDAQGDYLSPHAGLAHRRLSVIDLEGGRQPMQKYNEGRKCTIVYNGELYNTEELKASLAAFPAVWETSSDTEVILNGYLFIGEAFFNALNGIFAFAIYDEGLEALYLCRDRLGVKPLFWQDTPEAFIFGSEPKALFAAGIRPEIDDKSFCEIFALGPARTPGCGVFKNMREVLPGHYLCLGKNSFTDKAYWQLEGRLHRDGYETTVRKVTWLVKDSVRRQMVSDIPICTFLSGGIDSSLVSAICAEELAKAGKQLNTYSFDFKGNRENFRANAFQSSQDRPFVDIMANHIRSRHTYLECSSYAQANALYKAVDACDLPCMADVESSMLYFCSLVAEDVKVALTGECADEIFGGYPWFHQAWAFTEHHFPWSRDMDARCMLLCDDFYKPLNFTDYAQDAYYASLAQTPVCESDNPAEKRRREIAWLNVRWFMPTLLNRMDRTSMYSGLEARVPFADHRILEYVYNVPWDYKCRNGQVKSLLVEAGKELLPDQIRFRKKSPYPKTYDPGYERLLGLRLLDALSDSRAPIRGIVDKQKVEAFIKAGSDYGRPWYGQLMAGPQMLAYLLQVNYWMKKYGL